MRPPVHRLLLMLPFLTLLGCSRPRFDYEVDPSFKTAAYRTMALDPRKDLVLIREGQRPADSGGHRQAVMAELVSRNYQVVPPEAADLWVAVYVFAESPSGVHREGPGKGARPERTGGGGRRGGGTGAGASIRPRDKGDAQPEARPEWDQARTVIVQLQDRKTGVPMWQGVANLDPREWHGVASLDPGETMRQLLQPLPALP